jgi:uncharacterized protein
MEDVSPEQKPPEFTPKDVVIVVSRIVFPGKEAEYDDWIRKMVALASDTPGNIGITRLIPRQGKAGIYHVMFRFKDQKSADAWEQSPLRQKLTEEANAFSRHIRQSGTGLETWFNIPDCPEQEIPSHWKQAIVTFIGVFVMSTLFIKITGWLNMEWNFYLMNLLVSALVVGSLTWLVMPFLTRVVFKKWLYK